MQSGELKEDDAVVRATRTLYKIGRAHNIDSFAPIALAWLFAKHPQTFPIVGFNNKEQLADNIRSLSIKLSDEEVPEIDSECERLKALM